MQCTRCGTGFATVFCPTCGKADRESLKSVGIVSFTGRDSLNDNVERFWNTGDPAYCD